MSFPYRRKPKDSDDKPKYKRKAKERITEAKRAEDEYTDSSEHQNIRSRLGLQQKATETAVKKTLRRFLRKRRIWKVIGLTEADFIAYGFKI